MAEYVRTRRSLHWPITLSVVLMSLNVALMVCWIFLLAHLNAWTGLTIGTVVFAVILLVLVLYMIYSIKEVRLNQRQANFVDSVTHELKTPIASLRLYLETLQMRDLDDPQQSEFYDVIEQELTRLNRLINQLLEVGRLDAIGQEADPEDIALEPLLRQCAQAACAHHKYDETEVFTFNVEPAVVHARPMVLEMIFGNLLDNAVKYASDKPQVEVNVSVRNRGRVVTRICDNGKGVSAKMGKKIFKIFYRGGKELERTKKGTGLGLYIVRTLVHMLKGEVSVQGRVPGPGSMFVVELPGRAGVMKILIVEDEAALARGLRFNFEQEKYGVEVAGDGPTALERFKRADPPFDLIILDLMLPGMSGYETCRAIREIDNHVPILVLSARSLSEDRTLAFDCGSDQYMTKPFALPELLSRVRNLTERRRSMQPNGTANGGNRNSERTMLVSRFGDVLVDFGKYQVTVAGKTHDLTHMECQLLRYFIENEGQVLSRSDILAKVWGDNFDDTTRTIDNFVLRLRKLIEPNPSEPRHLLSVRGTGYRFVGRPESRV